MVVNEVYYRLPMDHKYIRRLDIFLFTFAKYVEPHPLPWFKVKLSTGQLLVVLWTALTTFLVMAFQSNLRVTLMTMNYEKPLLTLQDLLDQDLDIFYFDEFVFME